MMFFLVTLQVIKRKFTNKKKDIMKFSLLSLDLFAKKQMISINGGQYVSKVCGCICVGPVTPGQIETQNGLSEATSDEDCADCGAANAHRVSNG